VRYRTRFWLVLLAIAAVAVALLIWAGLRMGDSPEQPPAAAPPAEVTARR
jgi:hypothetical protein